MKKYIYMKVCDFKEPAYFSETDSLQGYYDAAITFATNLVVTTDHEPKELFKGEVVLVLDNGILYARFEGEENRLYRYVKQGRYRNCSYSTCITDAIDIAPVEGKRVQAVKKMHIFEVCVTNSPRNKNTLCTVDEHHAELAHIKWQENVKRIDSEAVEEMLLTDEIQSVAQRFKHFDKLLNKSLKAKGA